MTLRSSPLIIRTHDDRITRLGNQSPPLTTSTCEVLRRYIALCTQSSASKAVALALDLVSRVHSFKLRPAMASTASTDNTSPMHGQQDLKADPEKAEVSIPRDKPGDATKLEDASPPDGGLTAWLVVLGAWCCSFSSPGWINSMYSASSQCHCSLL